MHSTLVILTFFFFFHYLNYFPCLPWLPQQGLSYYFLQCSTPTFRDLDLRSCPTVYQSFSLGHQRESCLVWALWNCLLLLFSLLFLPLLCIELSVHSWVISVELRGWRSSCLTSKVQNLFQLSQGLATRTVIYESTHKAGVRCPLWQFLCNIVLITYTSDLLFCPLTVQFTSTKTNCFQLSLLLSAS